MRKEYFLLCIALPLGIGFGLMHMVFARPQSNPPILASRSAEARLDIPPSVAATLDRACQDCHSNRTRWPWFARIAPASWVISRDVERGRRAMNLSQWAAKPRIAMGTLSAACQNIQTGRMPPASYRWMHPEARLGSGQIAEFCDWTEREAAALRDQITRRILKSARVPLPSEPETLP